MGSRGGRAPGGGEVRSWLGRAHTPGAPAGGARGEGEARGEVGRGGGRGGRREPRGRRWPRPRGPGRHLKAAGARLGNRVQGGDRLCRGLLSLPCPSAIGRWREAQKRSLQNEQVSTPDIQEFPVIKKGDFTDSCSSHPISNPEELEEKDAIGVRKAAQRRLQTELGIPQGQISPEDILFMTIYHHKAKSDKIWGEHEICYLLLIQKNVTVNLDPSETKSFCYMTKEELTELLERGTRGEVKVTPWLKTITENFLYKWWPHLNEVTQFVVPRKIHRV
ncbi:isopentenyl-diphosphate delta-isomerase 2-like [Choloepus didactylus]|uniref:isopentenyl-diphosphate delta-isomerase 2-like n=1 Tax=Choloepus didactylus TaxID=27675 RepID=UPI00189EB753|nr:isopentenyl-diphosphate delta-isomerase 2-like [Choloepus didactylus]